MNPFNTPEQIFDVQEFLQNDPKKVEILFKSFFQQQVNEDLTDSHILAICAQSKDKVIIPPQLKNYYVMRYVSPLNSDENDASTNSIEIIQAYTQEQASYLFLLNEAKLRDSFPFTERLQYWVDMGPLTPYDVYLLTVDSVFDKDLYFNDYLIEIDELVIVRP